MTKAKDELTRLEVDCVYCLAMINVTIDKAFLPFRVKSAREESDSSEGLGSRGSKREDGDG